MVGRGYLYRPMSAFLSQRNNLIDFISTIHSEAEPAFCNRETQDMTLIFAKKVLSLEGILIATISASTEPIRSHTSPQSQACLELWHSVLGFNLSPSVETDVQKPRSYCRVLTFNHFDGAMPSVYVQRMDDACLFDSLAAFWLDMYNDDQSILDPSVASSSRICSIPKDPEQGAGRATGKGF